MSIRLPLSYARPTRVRLCCDLQPSAQGSMKLKPGIATGLTIQYNTTQVNIRRLLSSLHTTTIDVEVVVRKGMRHIRDMSLRGKTYRGVPYMRVDTPPALSHRVYNFTISEMASTGMELISAFLDLRLRRSRSHRITPVSWLVG